MNGTFNYCHSYPEVILKAFGHIVTSYFWCYLFKSRCWKSQKKEKEIFPVPFLNLLVENFMYCSKAKTIFMNFEVEFPVSCLV